jgi:hypothetical protein
MSAITYINGSVALGCFTLAMFGFGWTFARNQMGEGISYREEWWLLFWAAFNAGCVVVLG